jgi:hypothetical protein
LPLETPINANKKIYATEFVYRMGHLSLLYN